MWRSVAVDGGVLGVAAGGGESGADLLVGELAAGVEADEADFDAAGAHGDDEGEYFAQGRFPVFGP